jgi:NitT/TauT family transport system substrate-binding protein
MRVGYVPLVVNLPLFVALEEGFFEKHGLKVEAIEAQSPNHIVDGIVSGKLEAAGVLGYPVIFAAEQQNPGELKIFQSGDETSENFVAALVVPNGSPIGKIEDLKGKRIGVWSGLTQVVFTKGILIGMGLNPEKDVTIVEIEPRLQVQGLAAGQFDVLSTAEPYPTIASGKNVGTIWIENPRVKYIQNPFPSVAVPVSAEFLQKNPKAAKAYLLALQDAIDFIRQNPEKAKSSLVKYTPIPKELASKVRMPQFNRFGEEDQANVQKNADWLFENGLLKKRINVATLFGDPNFLQ